MLFLFACAFYHLGCWERCGCCRCCRCCRCRCCCCCCCRRCCCCCCCCCWRAWGRFRGRGGGRCRCKPETVAQLKSQSFEADEDSKRAALRFVSKFRVQERSCGLKKQESRGVDQKLRSEKESQVGHFGSTNDQPPGVWSVKRWRIDILWQGEDGLALTERRWNEVSNLREACRDGRAGGCVSA